MSEAECFECEGWIALVSEELVAGFAYYRFSASMDQVVTLILIMDYHSLILR